MSGCGADLFYAHFRLFPFISAIPGRWPLVQVRARKIKRSGGMLPEKCSFLSDCVRFPPSGLTWGSTPKPPVIACRTHGVFRTRLAWASCDSENPGSDNLRRVSLRHSLRAVAFGIPRGVAPDFAGARNGKILFFVPNPAILRQSGLPTRLPADSRGHRVRSDKESEIMVGMRSGLGKKQVSLGHPNAIALAIVLPGMASA